MNAQPHEESADLAMLAMATEAGLLPLDEDAAEALRQQREARRAAMDQIGEHLMGRLSEAVMFRANFEQEWEADIRQYECGDPSRGRIGDTKQHGSDDDHNAATDNITRPAVITYAARLGDMLFPTNDRNWDVDITPEPELPPDVVANIEASVAEAVAQGAVNSESSEAMVKSLLAEVARKRMAKMRTRIDDQLSESHYNAKGRQVIFDACKIGFGVMKGPFAKTRTKRRLVASEGFRAEIIEDLTAPCVDRRDPWSIFPMPCRRIADCPGVFELHELSAKKLAALRNQPGFSSEQVGRALRNRPSWSGFANSLVGRRALEGNSIVRSDELYPVVEYDGDMPADALLVFLDQLLFEQKINEEQRADIMAEVQDANAVHLNCNVWMCGGTVLKVAVNPVDHCSQMYKFFVFEDREDGPFGRSVCSLLREPQQNVRMLWSAILLNSMMSAGVQIALKKGALVPLGGQAIDYRFTKPRVWAYNDDIEDIRKAMQVFQIPNVVGALVPVYERAKLNGGEQIMLPAIAQGEPTQAVPTSSGLAMLMNAANIVQRRLAARWDDEVTTPIITDFYEWNMKYGPDEAKGDYLVRARASSHLLVKDIQAQHFLNALKLFQSNPLLQPRMKDAAWAEEALRIMDIDFHRFLLSEEEFEAKMAEQAKGAAPDAETLKAQAAAKVAEARITEAQAMAQYRQAQVQLQAEDRALDYEDKIADRETRERIAAMQVQAAMAGLNAEQQQRVMELQAAMQREAERNATQTRIAGMRVAAEAEKAAMEAERDRFEVAAEANTEPGPRLA